MTDEEIKKALFYIKTHAPQETEFKTIDVAINSVNPEIKAATMEDLINADDIWLVPDDEKNIFVGVKSIRLAESFSAEVIALFKEAVQYAKEHASDYQKIGGISNVFNDEIREVNKKYDEGDDDYYHHQEITFKSR